MILSTFLIVLAAMAAVAAAPFIFAALVFVVHVLGIALLLAVVVGMIKLVEKKRFGR